MQSLRIYRLGKSFGAGFTRRGGFTLVEVLVVSAIGATLLGFGLFMSMDAYRQYTFQAERSAVVSVLQKARSRALGNLYQSPHGVCYISPDYIIFRGTQCVPGVASNESIPSNVSLAHISHFPDSFPVVVFSQLDATTSPAVINLSDAVRSASIQVNYEGTISW